jgi:ABC-2 type transport system ATP-binding protein
MLGPNGAGKTTTVKMLTTLLRPTAGSAIVGGFDVVREPNKVRKLIGYLPQQLTSDDSITGYENVLFYAKLYGVPKDGRDDRINHALEQVGLAQWANGMVSTYSGGMKRRLELASVLISRPRIFFLDEPTLGLDPRSRALIWDFLRKLRDEFGITIFLTTNYMDEADKLCDRVAIIDAGKVIVDGSPRRLKGSIGGELITLKINPRNPTRKPDASTSNMESQEVNQIERVVNGHPHLKVADHSGNETRLNVQGATGEELIPSLLAELKAEGVEVLSVTLQKPGLDEVFTAYTGKNLTEEALTVDQKKKDQLATIFRAMRDL